MVVTPMPYVLALFIVTFSDGGDFTVSCMQQNNGREVCQCHMCSIIFFKSKRKKKEVIRLPAEFSYLDFNEKHGVAVRACDVAEGL
jgi:hypothetical protein